MRPTAIAAVSALAAVTACSAPEESVTDQPIAAEDNAATAGPELTPEFMAGAWCYERYEGGSSASDEQLTFVFNADGTLKYQEYPSKPVELEGSYAFENGALRIRPLMDFIPLKPVSVSENAIRFETVGGTYFWTRGACGS